MRLRTQAMGVMSVIAVGFAGLVVPMAVTPTAAVAPLAAATPRVLVDDTLGSWSPLGAGTSGVVYAVAVHDDTVYAGGDFTDASGVPGTKNMAAWSNVDDTWHPLGAGTSDTVPAVAVHDDTVYAGGSFTSALGVPGTSRIAAWSNVDDTWHPLGAGMGYDVWAVAVHDDTVYAGGDFLDASGVPGTKYMAAWSNVDDTWHPLVAGMSDRVMAVAVHDDTVYAGGNFLNASGVPGTRRIAAWSNVDDTWHALGAGIGGMSVDALAVDDTRGLVYAGGDFTRAQGGAANSLLGVGVWDVGINEWIPFKWGSAVNSNGVQLGNVYALAVDDSRVYVGGNFLSAGGNAAAAPVAMWTWAAPQGSNSVTSLPVTLSGTGFIGVPRTGGVTFNGTPVSYTRDDSTTITVTSAAGATSGAIRVNGVGGWGNVGTYTTTPGPDPIPTFPPSAPLSVTGTAGDASAVISWAAPASTGSYPITHYQAVSQPGGHSCLTPAPATTCTMPGLNNGTTYTFTVTALNGAGWGTPSTPSAPVTPTPPPMVRIVLDQGTRTADGRQDRILTTGTTTAIPAGAQMTVYLRFDGQNAFSQGRVPITVNSDGTFTWTRTVRKNRELTAYLTWQTTQSNTVSWPTIR